MMRKLSLALTAVALLAVMATAAFAQPNITGVLYVASDVTFGDKTEYAFGGYGRVNISGSVSEDVSYYARIQGGWGSLAPTTSAEVKDPSSSDALDIDLTADTNAVVPLAYLDVKNVLGSGSTLRFGRQSVSWGVHNYFAGLSSGTMPAVSVTLSAADNVTLRGFVQLAGSDPLYGAKATFNVPAGALGLNLRSGVNGGERKLGYSVDADVEFSGVHLNAEVGKTVAGSDLQIVGLSFDAVSDAIGWDNYIEYNIPAKRWAVGISKDHANNLTTAFTVNGGEGRSTVLTTELSVSF